MPFSSDANRRFGATVGEKIPQKLSHRKFCDRVSENHLKMNKFENRPFLLGEITFDYWVPLTRLPFQNEVFA